MDNKNFKRCAVSWNEGTLAVELETQEGQAITLAYMLGPDNDQVTVEKGKGFGLIYFPGLGRNGFNSDFIKSGVNTEQVLARLSRCLNQLGTLEKIDNRGKMYVFNQKGEMVDRKTDS
jgi:hypothetical protein